VALQTFDEYLDDVLAAAKAIRTARDASAAIMARHTANDVGSLTEEEFGSTRKLTKVQYDALTVSFVNLETFWGVSGNGTNIERSLTENLG